jgi:hypothetical protein
MEIVRPKQFSKESMQTTVTIPAAKDTETTRPFQWMLFKPQLHAVTPFETNRPARDGNTGRFIYGQPTTSNK